MKASLIFLIALGFGFSLSSVDAAPKFGAERNTDFIQRARGLEKDGYRFQDTFGIPLSAEESVSRLDSQIILPRVGERIPEMSLQHKVDLDSGILMKWELYDVKSGTFLGGTEYQFAGSKVSAAHFDRSEIIKGLVLDLRKNVSLEPAEAARFEALVTDLI